MASNDAPGVAATDPVIRAKYIEERNKRLRAEGSTQFIKLSDSTRFSHLANDPWADHANLNALPSPLPSGSSVKFLILGAGYGGLLAAVRLMDEGYSAADIRLVDNAGGFGGTWYWNRYPGLMCDIESYVYMPLLEETGYMPRQKYSHGAELREQAERIAEKWDLQDKCLFRTKVHSAEWSDDEKRWTVKMTEGRGPKTSGEARDVVVKAQYVLSASGALTEPHMPNVPGVETFQGQLFHASRWDYGITGGSPEDWTLEKLKGKRVGIIGTGATAIQVVPQLARWAKELYVFQRTPSSIDVRGQKNTDPVEWEKITKTKGWQKHRSENLISYQMNTPNGEDLVNDSWTRMPAYSAAFGAPGVIALEEMPQHVTRLHDLDVERANRVRARVDEVVKDKTTAEKLKAWYPVWCKTPTFHDDYLPAFNQPNVKLVDTDGKGVEKFTETGVTAGGTDYPIDVLVMGTGFVSPLAGTGSPAHRAGIKIFGRGHLSLDDKWSQQGASTLHGVATHDFPNLFFQGPSQIGLTVNVRYVLDTLSSHIATILSTAEREAGNASREKLTIEVTKAAEEAWSLEILKRAPWFVGMVGCTPGFINVEGEKDRPVGTEEQIKSARGAPWGEGILGYIEKLSEWKKEGGLQGLEIAAEQYALN
ncbi:phenylacetone monooxygenase [Corynespora cassiicola Philippines]|uniref:Phenylacetone monooxygenase n=1 Tax=Corynespora cassiicola Philippines TaxID=1448308 RepID=A0A2T2P6N1_CORCC|nr:phenylacetone monooxygenase [Corynespora cassiicola Philippines]